jgi:hypothetical protein
MKAQTPRRPPGFIEPCLPTLAETASWHGQRGYQPSPNAHGAEMVKIIILISILAVITYSGSIRGVAIQLRQPKMV